MAGKAQATNSDTREIVSGGYFELRATPAEGCGVCTRLEAEWFQNSDRDVLIEINNHPHEVPGLSRVRRWLGEGVSVG